MKSLTYFSKYNGQKKDQDGDKDGDENAVDIDTLRESMEGVSRRLEQAKNAQIQLDAVHQAATSEPKAEHEHVVPEGESQQQLSN